METKTPETKKHAVAQGRTQRFKSYKRDGKWFRISRFTGREEPLVIDNLEVY